MFYLKHLRARIILVSVVLLGVVVVVSSSAAKGVQAAPAATAFSNTQMYSSNFTATNLPTDGTTQATLTSIPFTVPSAGKVGVTAIFSLMIFDPSNPAQSCVGCMVGTLSCAVLLGSSSLISLSDTFHSYNVVTQEYSLTTTATAQAGSHKVKLQCTGLLNSSYTSLVLQATGRGMSAIVVY